MVLPGLKKKEMVTLENISDEFLERAFSILNDHDLHSSAMACRRFFSISKELMKERNRAEKKKKQLSQLIEQIKRENGYLSKEWEEDLRQVREELQKKKCLLCGKKEQKSVLPSLQASPLLH